MRSQPRGFWRPKRLCSLLGAKRLSVAEFIGVTELVVLLCVPFMLRTQRSRVHFRALISSVWNLGKFGVLLLIGQAGIVLYAFCLSRGHSIVVSAVLNLDPFWAAIIAYLIAEENSDLLFDLHTVPRRGVCWRDASRDQPGGHSVPFVEDL
jgi:drug/metabolite transporter (DMT)-like permease